MDQTTKSVKELVDAAREKAALITKWADALDANPDDTDAAASIMDLLATWDQMVNP